MQQGDLYLRPHLRSLPHTLERARLLQFRFVPNGNTHTLQIPAYDLSI
jgi:hypothetical protein